MEAIAYFKKKKCKLRIKETRSFCDARFNLSINDTPFPFLSLGCLAILRTKKF